MVNNYELLYILPTKYTEEELVPIKESIKKLITSAGGQITLEDNLGKKKFAYPIKKARQGYYLLYEFKLEGLGLKKLDNDLKLNAETLRHLITRKEAKSSSMIQLAKNRAKAEQEKNIKDIQETKEKDKDKIKLEDLDKKLDEILDSNII